MSTEPDLDADDVIVCECDECGEEEHFICAACARSAPWCAGAGGCCTWCDEVCSACWVAGWEDNCVGTLAAVLKHGMQIGTW